MTDLTPRQERRAPVVVILAVLGGPQLIVWTAFGLYLLFRLALG